MALIFGTSHRQRSAKISRALKAGKLRKLASKLYTDDLKSPAEAMELGWERELEQFDAFVRALRGKPSNHQLVSDLAKARARGQPYDPERVALFAELHARQAQEHFPEPPAPPVAEHSTRAFWEAYFSNFIEGTKFSVEEAQELVKDSAVATDLEKKRPEDAHDIKET